MIWFVRDLGLGTVPSMRTRLSSQYTGANDATRSIATAAPNCPKWRLSEGSVPSRAGRTRRATGVLSTGNHSTSEKMGPPRDVYRLVRAWCDWRGSLLRQARGTMDRALSFRMASKGRLSAEGAEARMESRGTLPSRLLVGWYGNSPGKGLV